MKLEPKKIKINLLPLHSFSRPGGVKNHALALQKEFKKRGIQSKIIVPRRKNGENYGRDIKLLGTSFPFYLNGTQSDFTICFKPNSIDKLLKEEGPDILHFHNFGLHSWQILEKSKAINILTFHSCLDFKSNKFLTSLPFVFDIFKKSVNEKVHGIIGVAPLNLDIFEDFRGPEAVIPNGIDIEKFSRSPSKIRKYLDGKINLLFVGRIEERKGLIYLLEAYRVLKKKFKKLRLIVVGKGKLEQEHKQWVKNYGLKDVIFEGELEGEIIPSYYATCDIFCAPAIFGESFGVVLLEAMASGKPIAGFANRGYKNVLTGKGKKFLAKPKDWQGLAQKIEILIKNKGKQEEMGDWGRKEVQKYAWPKIADRVLDFYQTVIENRK